MRYIYRFLIFALLPITISCEDIIHLDLNSSDPRYVIEAEINNLSSAQQINITQTVDFDNREPNFGIVDASVSVSDSKGRVFPFSHTQGGQYIQNDFLPEAEESYYLRVLIGEDEFTASSTMPKAVPIDSIGFVEENIFGEDYYFVVLKFQDPPETSNYYLYSLSVNNQPFKFTLATSDKFNNGLSVEHRMADNDNNLSLGDTVAVIRSSVDYSVYKYWSEYQSTNPGSAAPANPTSNISNNALGYFSVSNSKTHGLKLEN